MISKKIGHDVLTFHNNWINDKHVVAEIQHFLGKCISVRFSYWTIKNDVLDKELVFITKDIYTKKDYDNYVKEVNNKLNSINSVQ